MGQYDVTESDVDSDEQGWDGGMKGARLFFGGTGYGLEGTIVSTSLVAITDDLRGFGRSSWIITSYLLTYAGFLMIWSKAGDIWGVKPMLLVSLAIFTAFSGGCSGAQSYAEHFKALELQHYAAVTGLSGVVFSLGLVLGPLFGGAIAEDGNWRWVFLLNVPAGAVSWGLIFFSMPPNFPATSEIEAPAPQPSQFWSQQWSLIRQVDFLGAFLVLAASVFIVAALQEVAPKSTRTYLPANVALAIVDKSPVHGDYTVCLACFTRLMNGDILTSGLDILSGSLTTGLSMTVSIVEIPQRFQVVNGSSPIGAGVKLLAFAVSVPAGMMFCSILTGRLPVPLVYVGIGGVIMQVVGFFLFSEIKPETHIWPGQFGYLVLSGLGTGLGVAVFYLMLPLVVAVTDQSIALGTGFQLRMLGGALGIAAATAILHSHTRSGLSALLPSDEVDAFSVSTQLIDTLTPSMQSQVREVYAEAYSMQMKMVGGFSAAQFLALGLVWKRQNVRIVKR
ncbi:hypothetical protein AnigIFM63604_004452 [Aspergillus niger]|uniref:Major facilitator superfamily (MFS) profile domain-containing protein n=1 Tax=Aspergillus niger TaxID=5061 RepID=A0A9W5ZW35_ASPNG|nr:hypothetical protein AnigIFM63604_004452 [Aspergillus niger]